MTWTKLGDEFPAEARALTSDEFRLHVEALCWSNKRLLDLYVPKRDLLRLSELDSPEEAAEGLTGKGWWQDDGDTWYVGVNRPEWQVERVVEEKRQQDNALRQRRNRRHKADDHSLCLPGGPCPDATEPTVTRYETRDVARDITHYETRRTGRGGTGPTDSPAPKDQEQPQDQAQGQDPKSNPVTKSQNRRLRNGSETVADDAQHFPRHDSERTTDGTGARARRTDTPAA